MPTYKAPGVYISEQPALQPQIVAVKTAIPVFIGYTEKAQDGNQDVTGQPVEVASMTEFMSVFGGPPSLTFGLVSETAPHYADFSHSGGYFRLVRPAAYFRLYRSMQLFFANGGGHCYVVSAGHYDDNVIERQAMDQALATLQHTEEPTLLVLPDAMALPTAECHSLQQAMLEHCARKTGNCFALLDIADPAQPAAISVTAFRSAVSTLHTGSYGAAYFPWLHCNVVASHTVDFRVFDEDSRRRLQRAIADEPGYRDDKTVAAIKALEADLSQQKPVRGRSRQRTTLSPDTIDKTLRAASDTYLNAIEAVTLDYNLLPPSASVAGAIATNDIQHGVWKAPANVALQSVVSPSVIISDTEQQWLTTSSDGKSVNAIRYFSGSGTRIWGARTLMGNDVDWRYINVRRTCIMLEQSIGKGIQSVVFEPNDANLWHAVKAAIDHFLADLWRQGAFTGQRATEAYFVSCGLGETMTATDIAADKLIIRLGIAFVRPAVFTVLTLNVAMQHR